MTDAPGPQSELIELCVAFAVAYRAQAAAFAVDPSGNFETANRLTNRACSQAHRNLSAIAATPAKTTHDAFAKAHVVKICGELDFLEDPEKGGAVAMSLADDVINLLGAQVQS